MQQSCTYGSVRGALGNRRPYRDIIPALRLSRIPPGTHNAERLG